MKIKIKHLLTIVLLPNLIYSQYNCKNYQIQSTPITTSCTNPGVLPRKTLPDLGGADFSQSKKITISGWWNITPNPKVLNQY